ncbi:hypothetical protein DL93DRAFT_2069554, partial [Clavulina sp. PMI_390]
LNLVWAPGHRDIPGNDEADNLARGAANDTESQDTPIDWSVAAAPESLVVPLADDSKAGERHRLIRGKFSSRKAAALLSSLPCEKCSILVQLRLGHVPRPLREYLERFGHAETPHCNRCGEESVRHYLTTCRRLGRERMELRKKIRALENASLRNRGFDPGTLISHPAQSPSAL